MAEDKVNADKKEAEETMNDRFPEKMFSDETESEKVSENSESENKEKKDSEEKESSSQEENTEESPEEVISRKDKEIKEHKAEIAGLKDSFLRYQADTENYKKRLLRERDDAVLFANERLIKDLLEFFDNLDRVIQAAKNGGDAQSISKGVEMMQNQMMSTLKKNWGLERIQTTGSEFNPQEHEACMMETNPEIKTEMVSSELQAGYKLHNRVIRPAKVKVAKPE